MIKQNLHTHSCYDDGKDPIEEMVKTAIEKGFTVLGFSGHGFNHPLDEGSMTEEGTENYRRNVLQAREKYQDQIEIYLGIEQDSMMPVRGDWDYKIGSVHFLEPEGFSPVPVDYSREEFDRIYREMYKGDIRRMAEDYYRSVEKMIDEQEFDIVGHIDLITKFNENKEYLTETEDWYLEAAKKAVLKGIEKNRIFEMNTGAVSRGYRSQGYPSDAILKMLSDHGAMLCVNTDCHDRNNLDCLMEESIERARAAGFKSLMKMTSKGFQKIPIDNFQK